MITGLIDKCFCFIVQVAFAGDNTGFRWLLCDLDFTYFSGVVALEGSLPLRSPERFFQCGRSHNAKYRLTLFNQRNVYGKFASTPGELFGTIHGVYQPELLPVLSLAPGSTGGFFR